MARLSWKTRPLLCAALLYAVLLYAALMLWAVFGPVRSAGAASSPPGAVAPITLKHLHTGESLTLKGAWLPAPSTLNRFLRSHSDRRYTLSDPRLVLWAAQAARHFGKKTVLVVSAFRSRTINTRMHAHGHGVALKSRHTHGQALDLRIVGVTNAQLCRYFRQRRRGGVGCYNRFVHIDVGPQRNWGNAPARKVPRVRRTIVPALRGRSIGP